MKIKVYLLYECDYNYQPVIIKVTYSEEEAKDWEYSSTWKYYNVFEVDINE